MEYSAWDLVQHERVVPDVNGVSGVRSSLIANHPIGPLGQNVDELSLAFVPPLRADHDDRAAV
jgi:hypothetical protein